MFSPDELHKVLRLLRLKSVLRRGWTRFPIEPKKLESVADHSYGVLLLCWLFVPPELDKERTLELALIHDLAEIVTGDIIPADKVDAQQKESSEFQALQELLGGFEKCEQAQEILRDYQSQSSPEARWVKAMDKLDMSLQSLVYEEGEELDLGEFRRSAQQQLKTLGLDWLNRGKNDPV